MSVIDTALTAPPAFPLAPGRRVAVIGAGVAGLGAAHLLSRRHEVTLFEGEAACGGHARTVVVNRPDGAHAVDTGFIVFNTETYPHFTRLLDRLGVASLESEMSFAVRDERSGLEYRATDLDTFFAQRRNLLVPRFWRMIIDILRFRRSMRALLARPEPGLSLGEFLRRGGYSPLFESHFLVPMAAAIWSTSPSVMRDFPALFLARFFENHRFLEIEQPRWRTVAGGSRSYVERIVAPLRERLVSGDPVCAVRRVEDGVVVRTGSGAEASYDAAVVATHADDALALLADPTPCEREILGAFPYQPNDATLHTDASLLPRAAKARAAWNSILGGDADAPVALSYDMRVLQSIPARENLVVTLNRRPAGPVLDEKTWRHPLFTREGEAAKARWSEVNRGPLVFAGAYWRNGFHEDGLVSGYAAARVLGEEIP